MTDAYIGLPDADVVGQRIRTQRLTQGGVLVDQEVHTLAAPDGTLLDPATLATEATLQEAVAALAQAVAALQGTLQVAGTVTATPSGTQAVSGTIALDATTLAALESITAAVSGTVALDAPTLAALEAITVSGQVSLDATTLAALESVTAAVTGTVALDGPTLAALENITATVSGAVTVSGTVAVSNFPATQPVSIAATVTTDRPGDGINLDLTAATATVTPGSPLVITPASGKFLRIWWVCVDPSWDNSTTGRVVVNLAGKGDIYRQFAPSHRQRFDGSVNGTCTVSVAAGTCEATVHYQEV